MATPVTDSSDAAATPAPATDASNMATAGGAGGGAGASATTTAGDTASATRSATTTTSSSATTLLDAVKLVETLALVKDMSASALGAAGTDALLPSTSGDNSWSNGTTTLPFATCEPVANVSSALGVDLSTGLTGDQVSARSKEFGVNELPRPKGQRRYPRSYTPDMIAVADAAGSHIVMALRGGVAIEVAATDLVPGDVIALGEGDRVPADVRIVAIPSGEKLLNDRSALTGEPEGVQLSATNEAQATFHPSDAVHLYVLCLEGTHPTLAAAHTCLSAHPSAYADTNIEAGYGVAVVLSTGGGTYMGQMAQFAMATAEATYKGFPKRAAAKAMQEIATKARACVKHKETVVAASRCGAVMVDLPPERVLGSDKVGGAVTALANMVADGRTMYFLVAAPGAKDFTLQIATKVAAAAGAGDVAQASPAADAESPAADAESPVLDAATLPGAKPKVVVLHASYGTAITCLRHIEESPANQESQGVMFVAGCSATAAPLLKLADVGVVVKPWSKQAMCSASDVIMVEAGYEGINQMLEIVAPLKDAKGSRCVVM